MGRDTPILDIKEDAQIKISLSALMIIIAGVVGFATWMTTMQFSMNANAANVENLDKEKDNIKAMLSRIDKSLVQIKTRLGIRIDD
jgi:flagellar basal body-associated protein FliL